MADSGNGSKDYGLSAPQLAMIKAVVENIAKLPNTVNQGNERSARHVILEAKLGQLQPDSPNKVKSPGESIYLG